MLELLASTYNAKPTRMLEIEAFLQQLVSIDSQVRNFTGIENVQNILKDKLTAMGFKCEFIHNRFAESAPLLIGKKEISENAPTVTFIGHSDVVTPERINSFRIEDDHIYGSGVADDKGGVVLCLSAVENFLENVDHLNLNINIVISSCEETGSIGFHEVFKEIGSNSDFVLGLEPALRCGSLIEARGGNRWYHLNIEGRSAHSGRFGQSYINASHVLSRMITKMHELNDEQKRRRLNVGSFGGGHAGYNTICGSAWAKIDTRFASTECRDFIHTEIEKILKSEILNCPYSDRKARANYTIEDDCPPMRGNKTDIKWHQEFLDLISSIEEKEVKATIAGGAADINYFVGPHNFLLDGLGPIGDGLHTAKEYIKRSSLHSRTRALELFLMDLNGRSRDNVGAEKL